MGTVTVALASVTRAGPVKFASAPSTRLPASIGVKTPPIPVSLAMEMDDANAGNANAMPTKEAPRFVASKPPTHQSKFVVR